MTGGWIGANVVVPRRGRESSGEVSGIFEDEVDYDYMEEDAFYDDDDEVDEGDELGDDGSDNEAGPGDVASRKRRTSTMTGEGVEDDEDDDSHQEDGAMKARKKRRRGLSGSAGRRQKRGDETAEAALVRLTSSYRIAMDCVAALYKASRELELQRRRDQQTQEESKDAPEGASADSTAMVVVGETSTAEEKADEEEKDTTEAEGGLETLRHVAKAARTAFEDAILSDPLVRPNAPTFAETLGMEQASSSFPQRLTTAHEATIRQLSYVSLVNYADLLLTCVRPNMTPGKTILDRGVVRSIDVLTGGDETGPDELHRSLWWSSSDGVVDGENEGNASKDDAEGNISADSKHDNEERICRLALAAYCDASEMDGTDPTIWLKLACCARRLGNVLVRSHGTQVGKRLHRFPPYRRLERHALEQGYSALPPSMPRNRAIVRALQEFWDEEKALDEADSPPLIAAPKAGAIADTIDEDMHTSEEEDGRILLVVDLPRFSWSTLGRILMRACREGAAYSEASVHVSYVGKDTGMRNPSPETLRRRKFNLTQFGSPAVHLRISPILTLPPRALGTVCDFLRSESGHDQALSTDVKRFESCCRALSTEIVAARAAMEQERNQQLRQLEQDLMKQDADGRGSSAASKRRGTSTESTSDLTRQTSETVTEGGETPRSVRGSSAEDQANAGMHRSSKRVRSQLITSGKQAERSAKRKSVEYCLVSGMFGCTPDDRTYVALLKKDIVWEEIGLLQDIAGVVRSVASSASTASSSPNQSGETGKPLSAITATKRERLVARGMEAAARVADSSMSAFMQQWGDGRSNSGPMDMLHRFLAHVSSHVDAAFSSESGGSMVLSSCLLDCFEMLCKRSGHHENFCPSWFGSTTVQNSNTLGTLIEVFAINLLVAELKMKRSERQMGSDDLDGDVPTMSFMVPNLLRYAADLEALTSLDGSWSTNVIPLLSRCHWLAASFYLWWAKSSQQHHDVREAESRALNHIDETIRHLRPKEEKDATRQVSTPHLESPSRSGAHWKKLTVPTLLSYKDELQAASVVSRARYEFRALFLEREEKKMSDNDLSDEECKELGRIGDALFKRYDMAYEGVEGKHEELITDFVELNSNDLTDLEASIRKDTRASIDETPETWGTLWDVIPSSFSRSPQAMQTTGTTPLLFILATCLRAKEGNDAEFVSLLLRSALAAFDQFSRALKMQVAIKSNADGFSSFAGYGTDDSDIDEYDDEDERNAKAAGDMVNSRLLGLVARYLVAKATDVICESAQLRSILEGDVKADVKGMIFTGLAISAGFGSQRATKDDSTIFAPATGLFETVASSFSKLTEVMKKIDELHNFVQELFQTFFVGLIHLLVAERKALTSWLRWRGDQRHGRSVRQRICMAHADVIGSATAKLAGLLSIATSTLDADELYNSYILDPVAAGVGSASEEEKFDGALPYVQLCDTLVWFWKFITNVETDGGRSSLILGDVTDGPSRASSNTCERLVARRLLVPVAAGIFSLVGSSGFTLNIATVASQSLPADSVPTEVDFFDSDDSVTGLDLDDSTGDDKDSKKKSALLLQRMCQSIQALFLVFNPLSDKVLQSLSDASIYRTEFGNLLPVIAARSLSHLSDVMLILFSENQDGVWSEAYPYGTRSAGKHLDLLLSKAYRWLHGFALINQNQGPSTAASASPFDLSKFQFFPPESSQAAARLYRCIKRVYAKCRRSPPKVALECVKNALPPVEDTPTSKALHDFIFSGLALERDGSLLSSYKHLRALAGFEEQPRQLLAWEGRTVDGVGGGDVSLQSGEDETVVVRRGICSELAKGPMPILGAKSNRMQEPPQGKSDVASPPPNDAEERQDAARHENELFKKFQSVVDNLRYTPGDCDSWYNAGLCLSGRADVICDRLGSLKDDCQAADFAVSAGKKHRQQPASFSLTDLVGNQLKEYNEVWTSSCSFLGNDLSVYMRYPWASFSSLRDCTLAVQKILNESSPSEFTSSSTLMQQRAIWHSLESKFQSGDFVGWQRAWGGMYVAAVQTMAKRCLMTAVLLAKRQHKQNKVKSAIVAEIAEALGTVCYSELMGNTSYGYPMRRMTPVEKRKLADFAKRCFEEAAFFISVEQSSSDEDQPVALWELLFMIGKCNEKIAKTVIAEEFDSAEADSDCRFARLYEMYMNESLSSYTSALEEARKLAKTQGLPEVQEGGSSHGVTEVFYRMHASRLKVLISAVCRPLKDRHLAELEALRVTEINSFASKTDEVSAARVRERVWSVLADVVSAMAQCRLDHPYFHRSVYRHAQALLWAPVLHDPEEGFREGSLGTVPATKSYHLRGLNAGACANSGESIVNALFEKKRMQLCAVWVTSTASPSPFEILNDTVRKFDALRCKYIAGYIECMRLCGRKEPLETFLSWTAACARDLPSFYEASAALEGSAPRHLHTRENLLTGSGLIWNAKCKANQAIANILSREVVELVEGLGSKDDDDYDEEEKKARQQLTDLLKEAYQCFLRLKAPLDNSIWKSLDVSARDLEEVDAVCAAYVALQAQSVSIWKQHLKNLPCWKWHQKVKLLRKAIDKCEELFPALAPARALKKKARKDKSLEGVGGSAAGEQPSVRRNSMSSKASLKTAKAQMAKNKNQ